MKFILSVLINIFILFPLQLMIEDINIIKQPFFYIGIDIYKIINFIVLIITAISMAYIYKVASYNIKFISRRYMKFILLNIFIFFLYNLFTFVIISPFLSFTLAVFSFVFSLHLHEETIYIDNKNALLTPYIIWTFYLVLLKTCTFIINQ